MIVILTNLTFAVKSGADTGADVAYDVGFSSSTSNVERGDDMAVNAFGDFLRSHSRVSDRC